MECGTQCHQSVERVTRARCVWDRGKCLIGNVDVGGHSVNLCIATSLVNVGVGVRTDKRVGELEIFLRRGVVRVPGRVAIVVRLASLSAGFIGQSVEPTVTILECEEIRVG